MSCRHCNKLFLKKGFANHIIFCEKNPDDAKKKQKTKICPYCNNVFLNSLNFHTQICKQKPDYVKRKLMLTTCQCPYCGKIKTKRHLPFCEKNPDIKQRIKYNCIYCDKSFTKNGLNHHIPYCDKNPDEYKRQEIIDKKSKISILVHRNMTKSQKETHRKKSVNKSCVNFRKKHIKYKNTYFDSTWEAKYAAYLDNEKINWVRNEDSFEYLYNGNTHRYFPDFYLPELKCYIEIKGYMREKDSSKWTYFPNNFTLVILFKNDLKQLGIRL